MPLITCPDCEKRHSDAAPACPECGRPNAAVLAASPTYAPSGFAPQPPQPMYAPQAAHAPIPPDVRYPQAVIAPRLACPQCGTPDVRKLSLIYREGTAHIQTSTGGAVYGHGGGAVVGAHTRGSSQSLLSMGAAPPTRRQSAVPVVCGLFGVILLLAGAGSGAGVAILIGLGLLVIGIASGVSQSKWNREVFPQLYQQWDTTFLCTRCENRFIP